MKSIETILKENKKDKHLYEVQYYQKQAVKKARVKAIGIFKHY